MYTAILVASAERILSPQFGTVIASADKDDAPAAVILNKGEPDTLARAVSLLKEAGIAQYLLWKTSDTPETFLMKLTGCGDAGVTGIVIYGKPTGSCIADLTTLIETRFPRFFATRHFLVAMEDSETLAKINEFIDNDKTLGFIVGSSYLSENPEIYQRVDFQTFQILLRAVCKHIHAKGKKAFGSGGFCSYDAGKKDRNWKFAMGCANTGIQNGLDGIVTKFLNYLNPYQKLARHEPVGEHVATLIENTPSDQIPGLRGRPSYA